MEYRLDKVEAPADKTNSKEKVDDKRNIKNLEGCLAVSEFFQKPTYRALKSVGVNAGTQRTVTSLMDLGADPNLVSSSFLPAKWWSFV